MSKDKHIEFNHDAPDVILLDTTGNAVQISSFWKERPLLLAFTRHFGCTQCKEMLDELVAGKERIAQAGLGIVVVMQASFEATAEFGRRFAPGLTCLADPEREAYRSYGLERGTLFQTFLNPKVWSAISRSRKKGYHVEPPPPGQDAMQMSGTFIINQNGKIVLPYYYDHIADHPALDLVLSGALSTDWNRPFDGPIGPGVD